MKVTLESTTRIVELIAPNGTRTAIRARLWEGTTDRGIAVHAFVAMVAVHKSADCAQFEKELIECRTPESADIRAYPLRMIL